MAGMKVVVVKTAANGDVDVADFRAKAEAAGDRLAACMITYPSTHGVFEETVREICDITHAHGGQVYLDGANLNALVGLAKQRQQLRHPLQAKAPRPTCAREEPLECVVIGHIGRRGPVRRHCGRRGQRIRAQLSCACPADAGRPVMCRISRDSVSRSDFRWTT